MKVTDIKGKAYIEVHERVMEFWKLNPTGRINTEIVSLEDGVCIMKTSIYREIDNSTPDTVGYAYEKEGSTFINKTSYIENCETSAVGRALGMLGIGIDTSIASADEVKNAIKQQETKPKTTAKKSNSPAPKKEEPKTENTGDTQYPEAVQKLVDAMKDYYVEDVPGLVAKLEEITSFTPKNGKTVKGRKQFKGMSAAQAKVALQKFKQFTEGVDKRLQDNPTENHEDDPF